MPVNDEQRKWLEGKLPDFIRQKMDGMKRGYLPRIYEEFNAKFPVVPTTAEVTAAGGFNAALVDRRLAQDDMVKWWLYNSSKGSSGGSGNGGYGELNISSEPTRVLSAVNWYWNKYDATKIPIEVLARWKAAKGIEDNTDWLGEDEGLTKVQQLTAKSRRAKADALYKSIPLRFKNQVAQEMYDNEPQAIKDEVEKERYAETIPLESEINLLIRKQRLTKANNKIKGLNGACDNLIKNFEKTTGLHAVIIVGGPIPSLGGQLKCYGYGLGGDKTNFAVNYPEFNNQYLAPFAEHLAKIFPPEVCKSRSLEHVEALIAALPPTDITETQPPIDHAGVEESLAPPTSSRPVPRKKGTKQRKRSKQQVWKPAKEFAHLPPGLPSFINDPDTLRFTPSPSSPIEPLADLPEVSAGSVPPTSEAISNPSSLHYTVPATPTLSTNSAPAASHVNRLLAPTPPAAAHVNAHSPNATPTHPAESAPVAAHINTISSNATPTHPAESAPVAAHSPNATPMHPAEPVPVATHSNSITPPSAPQIDPQLIKISNRPAAVPEVPPPAFPPPSAPTPFAPRTVKMSNFPDWLRKSGKYLLGLDGGSLWNTLLDAFFDHESSLGFETGAKFIVSWVGAPDEITWWQDKAKQNVSKIPAIKLPDFGNSVENWWLELQPGWRGSSLSRDVPPGFCWRTFKVGGPNGMALVLMCMSWWLPFVTDDDRTQFTRVAEDMIWFLRQSDNTTSADLNEGVSGAGSRSSRSRTSTPLGDLSAGSKRKATAKLKQPAPKSHKRGGRR